MKKTFVWGFAPGEVSNVAQIKMTVGGLTVYDLGQHRARLKEARDYITELCGGKHPSDMTKEERDDLPPEVEAFAKWTGEWAHCIVATQAVWVARWKEPPDDAGEDYEAEAEETFVESSIEELKWDTPEGSLFIPTDFFVEWSGRVMQCNNGVFGPRVGDAQAKKKGQGLIKVT